MLTATTTCIAVAVVANVATPSPLTIISSMDPAFANETVLSSIPGMDSAGWDPSTVHVRLCAPGAGAGAGAGAAGCRADIDPLRALNGSVHWVVPAGAPDAEYEYAVCGAERGANGASGTNDTTTCSPPAALNQAQVWWHQCAYAWDPSAPPAGGMACGARVGFAWVCQFQLISRAL